MLWFLRQPTNDKPWTTDNAVLAEVSHDKDADTVDIRNIRNFEYRRTRDYDVDYYDRRYRLGDLHSLDYFVEPFSLKRGSDLDWGKAHTFVSFGLGDEQLTVSIEIRRQQGESFNPIRAMFRAYELIYVIANERDVVKLRTNHRRNKVYLYPIVATPEGLRAIFLGMLLRAEKLRQEPEFYNTLTNTCTTNLVEHVNAIVPGQIPFGPQILLPSYSAAFVYRLGLINTPYSFGKTRKICQINAQAQSYADDPDFSKRIRADHPLIAT
jgi:hypothetical protein